MRPGALATVALVAAALGAGGVLVVAQAAGWIDGGGAEPASTVVLEAPPGSDRGSTAAPLVGARFDPAAIYERVSPGVVTIYSIFGGGGGGGERAQGSGLVVSKQGHVLTNAHVITTAGNAQTRDDADSVRGAQSLYVAFADGDRLPGAMVGWDLFNDTGVIKVNPRDHALVPVPLGDSDDVVVGEPVAAIGSPFGNETSLAVGVVSAVSRSIPSLTSRYAVADAIQVDAPINQGNSGGPVLDAQGRAIGLAAQIRSSSGNAEGVGFAIPINSARRSLEQLISTGRVVYAYLGITTEDVTPALAREFDLGAKRGALINEILPGQPAERAGLKGSTRQEQFNGSTVNLGGDLILALNGRSVQDAGDVVRLVSDRLRPGQLVSVTVIRGGTGKRETVRVRLEERPATP